MSKELILYIVCGVLGVTVIGLIIAVCKKKEGPSKEGFSAAQRLQIAGRYAKQPNRLMPTEKSTPVKNQILLPLNNGTRGDSPLDYLLPSSGVDKQVGEAPTAKVEEAPPVIGGTETNKETPDATGVALNVTTEDAMKAGANSIATTDFHDQTIPDTSALPAVVQNGVVEEPAKEGYCGGNVRVCPQFISNGSFAVQHKLQRGGISTSKEGFRPSKHYVPH